MFAEIARRNPLLTLVQLHAPLIVGLLKRIRHFPRFGGVEKATQEGNRGHRTAKGNAWSRRYRERRGSSVKSSVAKGVEGADEVRQRWDTHQDRYIRERFVELKRFGMSRCVSLYMYFIVTVPPPLRESCSCIRHGAVASCERDPCRSAPGESEGLPKS